MKGFLTLFLLVNLVYVYRCDEDSEEEGLRELCSILGDSGVGAQIFADCLAEFIPKPGVAVMDRCVAEEANDVVSSVAYVFTRICAAGENVNEDRELSSIGKCIESTGIDMEIKEEEKEAAGERAAACVMEKLTAIFGELPDSSEEK